MTTALDGAVSDLLNKAVDGRGLRVLLVSGDVTNVDTVKSALRTFSETFAEGHTFIDFSDESHASVQSEIAAARNLALIATLYAEILAAQVAS